MPAATYHIPDEPTPTRLSRLAVNPIWPLLSMMLGGVWLSWPWYLANGAFIGSATRTRELAFVIGGLLGSAALAVGILTLEPELPRHAGAYLVIAIIGWKLGVTYWLQTLQGRSFALLEYFERRRFRSGFLVVAAGFILRQQLVEHLPAHPDLLSLVAAITLL